MADASLLHGVTAGGVPLPLLVDANGKVYVVVSLDAGDLEIGAVEIKDAITDTRAPVGANGLGVDLKAPLLAGRLDVNVGAVGSAIPVTDNAGSLTVDAVDGALTSIGALADAEAAGNGTVIALLKRLRTLLAGGLPAGLISGRLDVNLGAVGTAVPVTDNAGSLTIDAAQLPAALVGGRLDVNLGAGKAREDAAAMTWVDLKSAAPAASAVQADTGPLAAGDYDFDIECIASDVAAAGKGLVVEHRNAANGATLHTLGGCSCPDSIEMHLRRYTLALNERIRVIAGTAAGAAGSMFASAIGRRIS